MYIWTQSSLAGATHGSNFEIRFTLASAFDRRMTNKWRASESCVTTRVGQVKRNAIISWVTIDWAKLPKWTHFECMATENTEYKQIESTVIWNMNNVEWNYEKRKLPVTFTIQPSNAESLLDDIFVQTRMKIVPFVWNLRTPAFLRH